MQYCPLIVLKFGSSVLRSEDDLPEAVHEIYRWIRHGYRVLAVASAFAGTTDALLDQARRYGDQLDEAAVAALVATGEAATAALLTLALDRAGISAELFDAHQLGLRTSGPLLDAALSRLDCQPLQTALDCCSAAVVPGFVGLSPSGSLSLLGRGGSDLTALFLAERLGAGRCRLIKDVDGLFDHDPALAGRGACAYKTLTWDDALALDADVVQRKALVFAKEKRLRFEVACLGSDAGTVVGATHNSFCRRTEAHAAPLKVGLLGLGTVGLGVYTALAARRDTFTITKVAVRDVESRAEKLLPGHMLTSNVWEVLDSGCDVLVELMGGVTPAAEIITAALRQGKHVATANKHIVALHGRAWSELAQSTGAQLSYSAAVGGSVPMLEAAKRVEQERLPLRLRGVLNGTTTFVLDQVAAGADFGDAVQLAQQRGFAEADPTLDLDGSDAAQKLILLARSAFEMDLSEHEIHKTGIDQLGLDFVRRAAAAGDVVRLVASIEHQQGKWHAFVGPRVLSSEDPLAWTRGERCCLCIEWADRPPVVLRGKGAGRWPTTESVMADLFSLFSHRRSSSRVPDLQEPVSAGGLQ